MPKASQKRRERQRERRNEDRQPAPISDQHDRKQQTELRLVGQQAQADARKHWPPFQKKERTPDQRRREEAVLPAVTFHSAAGKPSATQTPVRPQTILTSVAA